MSNYRFDFNQADATLYDMKQIDDKINAGLQELERNVEKHLQDWDGAAKQAYWDAKAKWNASAGDMAAYLEQARQTLLQISDNYGSTEQRQTKIWNDVRGG